MVTRTPLLELPRDMLSRALLLTCRIGMLVKILRSKYPAISTEEEAISIPLQTLAQVYTDLGGAEQQRRRIGGWIPPFSWRDALLDAHRLV